MAVVVADLLAAVAVFGGDGAGQPRQALVGAGGGGGEAMLGAGGWWLWFLLVRMAVK